MAGENDQTRWIGIRPTNPAENIPVTESSPLTELDVSPAAGCGNFPVTESAPLTDIKVSPSAGSPEFLTLTEKRAPAIGDLQAPSAFVRVGEGVGPVGASPYDHNIYTVPAGKMFMLNFLATYCNAATPTQIAFKVIRGVTGYSWYVAAYGGAGTFHYANRDVLYDADEVVRITWTAINAADTVVAYIGGYLLDKY